MNQKHVSTKNLFWDFYTVKIIWKGKLVAMIRSSLSIVGCRTFYTFTVYNWGCMWAPVDFWIVRENTSGNILLTMFTPKPTDLRLSWSKPMWGGRQLIRHQTSLFSATETFQFTIIGLSNTRTHALVLTPTSSNITRFLKKYNDCYFPDHLFTIGQLGRASWPLSQCRVKSRNVGMPLLSTTLGVLGICSNSTIKLIMYGYLHIKFSTRRVIVGFNGRDKEVKEASDYRITAWADLYQTRGNWETPRKNPELRLLRLVS